MAEQDTQDLLRKNLELAKENNKMLKKMRRNALLGGVLKLVWIAIMIGAPIYIYINFLSPVLDQVLGAAETVQEVGNKVGGAGTEFQGKIKNIIDSLKGIL